MFWNKQELAWAGYCPSYDLAIILSIRSKAGLQIPSPCFACGNSWIQEFVLAEVTRRWSFANQGIFAQQVQEPHLRQIGWKVLAATARPYMFPIKHSQAFDRHRDQNTRNTGKSEPGNSDKAPKWMDVCWRQRCKVGFGAWLLAKQWHNAVFTSREIWGLEMGL